MKLIKIKLIDILFISKDYINLDWRNAVLILKKNIPPEQIELENHNLMYFELRYESYLNASSRAAILVSHSRSHTIWSKMRLMVILDHSS